MASSSEVSVRPTQEWPMWVSAWLSPSRSCRVIATAGTGLGPDSPPVWQSRARRHWPPVIGSAPAASCCGRPSSFRQAFFFHRDDLDGEELRTAYPSGVKAFQDALPLLDHQAEVLADGLSGYLFTPGHAGGRLPTLLHVGGYDGTAEELYASVGPALERGYVFAAIDGPGQGSVLYDQRIPMRPDWEAVVPRMVEALIRHPQVDPNRIVLVGRSFGGLIAPRGASGEHRLAAMVVDPGQLEMGSAIMNRLGELGKLLDDPAADAQFESLLTVPALHALLAPRMVTHGLTSVRAYCRDLLRYTNEDTASAITCPSFVTDNETNTVSVGQGKVLFDRLTCPRNSACSPRPKAPRATAKAWHPSSSGPPHRWLDGLLP